MRFSILIPVYNTARYLEQCLKSVLSQSYNDFEVILTNDGSTDDSAVICEKFAHIDNRISYYSKQNEGLLSTRRFALKKARGEYILFLDSDDFWTDDLLLTLSQMIDQYSYDMFIFNYHTVDDKGALLSENTKKIETETYYNESNKLKFLDDFFSSHKFNYLWDKCIRRELIDIDNDYSQFSDVYGEDFLQLTPIVFKAQSIYIINKAFICYRQSSNGKGRNLKPNFIVDTIVVRDYIYMQLLEYGPTKSVKKNYLNRCGRDIIQRVDLLIDMCEDYDKFASYINRVVGYKIYTESIVSLMFNRIIHLRVRDGLRIWMIKYMTRMYFNRRKSHLVKRG